MSEMRAEPLSPIDTATLWPQLGRLSTEIVATRAGENLLLSSGLAATGLTRLPRIPRTIVVGVKRALRYRGVLVARELAGGAAWEIVSIRIARTIDDETVGALAAGAALEAARRNGRILFVRYPESSPHATGLQRAGLISYREEHLLALPRSGRSAETGAFRPAARSDRAGTFRLYCKAVPQHVRRSEALTQQEWRAVIDSFDCEKEYVAEGDRGIVAWAGFGERECHLILEPGIEGLSDAALDLIESHGPRHGTLVLGDDQDGLHDRAAERGYTAMGVRLVCARRLAQLQSLKEVSPLPAESLA